MKRSWLALLVVAASSVAVQPVIGQETQPLKQSALEEIKTKEFSQSTMDLATQLVKLSGTDRTYDEILPSVSDSAKNAFIRANPQMQLGIIEVVDRLALTLVSRRPELDRELARIWAAGFTEDELNELIAFYKTETGKKFAALQPQMLAVGMSMAQQWGSSVNAELTRKVSDELRLNLAAEQRALQGGAPAPAQ